MKKSDEPEFEKFVDTYGAEINESLAFAGQDHGFYLEAKAKHLVDTIRSTFGPQAFDAARPAKVLDVGCGHGLMHPYLKSEAVALYGCDPAASVIEHATQAHPFVSYTANDGNHLPYADDSFDVAFTVCVMHHVPPEIWVDFLKEMRRVVRPGGLIAVYEHNPYNPVTRRIVNTCPLDENAVLLSKPTLGKCLRDAGIEDAHTEFLLFFPFAQEVFRKIEKRLTWLPMGAQYVSYAKVGE